MGKFQSKTKKFENGKLTLYTTNDSNTWRYKFYSPSGKMIRKSTGLHDESAALEVAKKAFYEMQFKAEQGTYVDKSFKSVALEVITELEKMKITGSDDYKVSYAEYPALIRKYLIPYFGKMDITKITEGDIIRWDNWRYALVGRKLNVSTISTHNSVLSYIFQYAIVHNYIENRPIISRVRMKKESPGNRPFFHPDEIPTLKANLIKWIKYGKRIKNIKVKSIRKKDTIRIRCLLYIYVEIVLNTGIRPGTECANLQWNHVEFQRTDNDIDYYQFRIKGKKQKFRNIVSLNELTEVMQLLIDLQPDLKRYNWRDLPNLERPILLIPGRNKTPSLIRQFKKFLLDYDMLKDNEGNERTLYSLRHTALIYYLRRMKTHNLNMFDIAKYMGTSISMIDQFYHHNQIFIEPEKVIPTRDDVMALNFADRNKRISMHLDDGTDPVFIRNISAMLPT